MLNGNIEAIELGGELTPSIELSGTINPVGPPGPPGEDGFSPIANVEQTSTGAIITITDAVGTTTADILNGEKGETGNDGYSPSASVTKSGDTATISITDKTGTTTTTITDGIDGQDGSDGYSPSASVTKVGDTATITITDKTGTTTASISDGEGTTLTAGDYITINNNVVSANIHPPVWSTSLSTDKGTGTNNRVYINDFKPGRYEYRNYSSAYGFYYSYGWGTSLQDITISNGSLMPPQAVLNSVNWDAFIIEMYYDLNDFATVNALKQYSLLGKITFKYNLSDNMNTPLVTFNIFKSNDNTYNCCYINTVVSDVTMTTLDMNTIKTNASQVTSKQDTLVSGTNIKTINNESLLGSGNITISGGGGTWGSITGTLADQTDLNTALSNKQDTLVSGTNIKTVNNNSIVGSGNVTIDASLTKLTYGTSTWDDFISAYNNNSIVYCQCSSNSTNPASGNKVRQASLAYVNKPSAPTEVEFHYYRTVTNKTSSSQCDEVYSYKLNKTSGWSFTKMSTGTKIETGTGLSSTYSNETITLNADSPAWGNITGTLSNQTDLNTALTGKQDTLVSGTNIKTINNTSILGSGDITISADDEIAIQTTTPTGNETLWINPDESVNVYGNYISNTYGTSTEIGYSQNYVNKLHTYSTDEIRVGTWMGKPVYRKVLIVSQLPNAGSYQWSIGVANLDLVKINYGESYMTWIVPRTYPLIRFNPQIEFEIDNNKNLEVVTVDGSYVNWTAYVVVEYTKTTD